MKRFAILFLALTLSGCGATFGNTPRQRAASAVNLALSSPFYAVTYLVSFPPMVLAYLSAKAAGEPDGSVPIWFSLDFGPNYASVNTPWCWLYAGDEPEDRELAVDLPAGHHVRQIPLRALDHEWPPAFTWCRTNVGTRWNRRGDESFPLVGL